MMASESDLRLELQSIEELMRDSTRLFPFIVGLATVRQRLSQMSASQPQPLEQLEDDEGIVVINPITRRAIFLGFERGSDGTKSGPAPASKPAIESLPVSAVEEGDRGSECAICLEELVVGEEAKWMPCKHRFHPDCIGKWLSVQGSCPVCRFLMPVEGVKGKKDGGGGGGDREDRSEWRMSVRLLVGARGQGGLDVASDSDRGLMGGVSSSGDVGDEGGAGGADGSGGQDMEH